jgi:accessory colonization factor AcfC
MVLAVACCAGAAQAAETLHVHGPGGPLPAIKEAAAACGKQAGVTVDVVGGPTPAWIERAKSDGDVIYSGAETMLTGFIDALPGVLDPATVRPLYLRPSSMLVCPGNPKRIGGLADLLEPGHRVLVVNGSGQGGLWEDMAGRTGRISDVKALRANIVAFAKNSAEAKKAWTDDPTIDAWIIWNIWQVSNPTIATAVQVEPEYRIHRDAGVAPTTAGGRKPEAEAFVESLASPSGQAIFERWGWMPSAER